MKIYFKISVGVAFLLLISGCQKTYTVDDFKKNPELAHQVTQTCLQLAENKKNPFKNKSCQALVYYEREQCQKGSNYLEANHCDEPLYLLSRENVPHLPRGAL